FRYETEEVFALKGSIWMSKDDWKRSWKPWLRGTFLGFPFGTLPVARSEIPTFLSYLIEKRLSKNPEEFGKGAIEAVAGPEAANNAAAAGILAPLLALGLAPPAGLGSDALGHGRHHARRLPAVRPAAGTDAVRHQPRAGLGPDRQP